MAPDGAPPPHCMTVGYVDLNTIVFDLPDGRRLLDDVSFRVGEGVKVALVGPNGAGKTTLLRIVAGDLAAHGGAVSRAGGLGVMRAVRRHGARRLVRCATCCSPLPRSGSATRPRELDAAEPAMMERDDEPVQMRVRAGAGRLGRRRRLRRRDAAGTSARSPRWACRTSGRSGARCATLSGGEQKRLVLEALLRGPDEVLLLDEPDNYLDVPGQALARGAAARVDRRRCCSSATTASCWPAPPTRIVTLEPGAAGSTAGRTAAASRRTTQAREDRIARLEELRRRWDEEHAEAQGAGADVQAEGGVQRRHGQPRYQAAQTRLAQVRGGRARRSERRASSRSRCGCAGGRTGKRAVVCERLELTGLMRPFDLEVWYGERVAVLGSNGSGKSHFLRLLAAGGTDPDVEHRPVERRADRAGARTPARRGSAPGCGPGWFAQTHEHPELAGRTLLEILHRGDDHRDGMGRASRRPGRSTATSWRTPAEQTFESLSGGQQARFQILLLELSGATLLLLDEPTDNLDLRVGRGAGGGAGRVRGHRARGHPRPLVRPRLRPVPGLRRRRRGLRVDRAGVGRGPGQPAAA